MMAGFFAKLLFDKADYRLVDALSELESKEKRVKKYSKLLESNFHSRGIKELASPQENRLISAMLNFAEACQYGSSTSEERIQSLRSLREEVLDGIHSPLHLNTARVVLQILKVLLFNRERLGRTEMLKLVHDLRTALLGQPRFIRAQLRKYQLLEMPESWNQITFDYHVHDSSTKGRKTPAHLIMDAWIKGIRKLQVVYYDAIPRPAVRELLETARIMEIDIRIGVEFVTHWQNRRVPLIWAPRGFIGNKGFLKFLDRKDVVKFLDSKTTASDTNRQFVISCLKKFEKHHLTDFNARFETKLKKVTIKDFLHSTGKSEPTLHALIGYIFRQAEAGGNGKELTFQAVEEFFAAAGIIARKTQAKSASSPKLSPRELIDQLNEISPGFRLTLNLSGLTLVEVIQLLYDCRGQINYLEIFNAKDQLAGVFRDDPEINELRTVLNDGNVVRLKQIVRDILEELRQDGKKHAGSIAALEKIGGDLSGFIGMYSEHKLKARIGSDSTEFSTIYPKMGFAVLSTLPRTARKRLRRDHFDVLPVSEEVVKCRASLPVKNPFRLNLLARFLPGKWFRAVRKYWIVNDDASRIGLRGNIVSLSPRILPEQTSSKKLLSGIGDYWLYLNSNLKIALKITGGFIPAFLSFMLTKDWWVLTWFGAVIWFGITGTRNVIQSVLGGGGIRRSSLLKWNDFISWQRVADSLFYTGFSVPLLDYVVKTVMMKNAFGITAEQSPVILFTCMATINGLYISGHNRLRGLPASAASGNFFRSFLSIPLAVAFNFIFQGILVACGVAGVAVILQQWAAVVSKTASDTVAGFIEGFADRNKNLSMRISDYLAKSKSIFSIYSRLELLFPDKDVLTLIDAPKQLIKDIAGEGPDLKNTMIINALDLMYFRMYQPQALNALKLILQRMSKEERKIFLHSQLILKREKEISQLFIDGIAGRNFNRALAFYLNYYPQYLAEIRHGYSLPGADSGQSLMDYLQHRKALTKTHKIPA